MTRRLPIAASAFSLLLCVVAMAMWARSDERRDEIARFGWRGAGYAIASERGRIGVDNRPQIDDFLARREQAIAEYKASSLAKEFSSEGPDRDLARHVQAANRFYAVLKQNPPPLTRHAIPYWAPVVAAWTILALVAWRWHRRQVRIAARRCADCGYDLRASTGRCPECGTPIPTKPDTVTA